MNGFPRIRSIFILLLNHRSLPILGALLAIALTANTLGAGWYLDDLSHRFSFYTYKNYEGLVKEEYRVAGPMRMYAFLMGDEQHTQELKEIGLFPWWMSTGLRLAFWRPLAAMTHVLDYTLWPNRAFLMHLHSVLWFALLVFVVALFYRQMEGMTSYAGLAAILYVLNDAHAMPVSMLANRHALIAALFGVLAVMAHFRWRETGENRLGFAAVSLFTLSLFSAESGLSSFAYLFSYAVFLDHSRWGVRVRSLLPYIAVIIVWRLIYNSLGYGVLGSDFYTDPIREPVEFLSIIWIRLPILVFGMFIVPSYPFIMVSESIARAWAGEAIIFLFLMSAVFIPVLRHSALSRFWLCAAVLATLPACAVIPHSRNLVFASIGAVGFMMELLKMLTREQSFRYAVQRVGAWIILCLFLFIHLVHSPLILYATPKIMEEWQEKTNRMVKFGEISPNKTLVAVNPPAVFPLFSLTPIRAEQGLPLIEKLRILSAGKYPVEVERLDERTLILRMQYGILLPPIPFTPEDKHFGIDMALRRLDNVLRSPRERYYIGKTYQFSDLEIKIMDLTVYGRPAVIEYSFNKSLNDPAYDWYAWQGGEGPELFSVPAVGERVVVNPEGYRYGE